MSAVGSDRSVDCQRGSRIRSLWRQQRRVQLLSLAYDHFEVTEAEGSHTGELFTGTPVRTGW